MAPRRKVVLVLEDHASVGGLIAGLLRPDAGAIRIAGIDALADPVAAKRLTAWISESR